MIPEEDIWQSHYYIIPKIYMKLTGIWPYQTVRKMLLFFVSTFTLSFSIIIPQTLYLLIGSTNINNLFDGIPPILMTIVFTFKLVQAFKSTKKMKTCIELMQKDWHSVRSDVKEVILRRHSEHILYLTKFYSIYLLITTFIYLYKPIIMTLLENEVANVTTNSSIQEALKLPFNVEYGDKLNQYSYLIRLHCQLAVMYHIFISIAVDSFYFSLIQHACGMFAIIGQILEDIGKDNSLDFHLNIDKTIDHNYTELLQCLRKHLHVLKFVEQIESMYSTIFLVSINLNMLCSSICAMQVIKNLNNAHGIAVPLSMYIGQMIHLFMQCWQAQILMDYSTIPYKSICKGNWYCTSKRCQKLFLLIIKRTMSPCKITAGKIMILSFETFGAVLKTSMSFLTLFRSFQ